MYNANSHGTQSYSTPASPNSYSTTTQHNTEGKVAYDKELASLFRATAANVTHLYREASEIGNNAFKAGYEQCYDDICEYIASEQQDGSGELSIEGQQLLVHRLREFARRKHLAQRHTVSEVNTPSPGFARLGHPESRPSSVAEYTHSTHQSNHQPTDRGPGQGSSFESEARQEQQLETPSAAEPDTEGARLPNRLQSTLTAANSMQHSGNALGDGEPDSGAELRREDDGNNTGDGQMESVANSGSCTLPRGTASRSEHGTPRGKRMLESFDLMDIEPPRRRLRRDDIEMT